MQQFKIRSFVDGDETQLCDLHIKTYAPFNGPVYKTAADWRRLFVDYPPIGPKRILIAHSGEKIHGYCAWSNTNHPLVPRPYCQGLLYELCIEKGKLAYTAGKMLIAHCLEEARREGIERFGCIVPKVAYPAANILADFGFFPTEARFLFGFCVTNLQWFISRIIDKLSRRVSKVNSIRFVFTQDFPNRTAVLGENGKVEVSASSTLKKKMPVVTMGYSDFTQMVMNNESVLVRFLTRKLSIQPLTAVPSVIRILSRMRIKNNRWLIPLIDWR